MKELVKVHYRAKFYQYSLCGCQVKIFKVLRTKQRPCRGHFWGEFWVLSLTNLFWLCWNLHQKLAGKNIAWRTFEKCEFSWEQDGLKVCTFGPTMNPHYSLKIAKIDKNRYYAGKIPTIGLSMSKSRSYLFPLSRKNTIYFCTI